MEPKRGQHEPQKPHSCPCSSTCLFCLAQRHRDRMGEGETQSRRAGVLPLKRPNSVVETPKPAGCCKQVAKELPARQDKLSYSCRSHLEMQDERLGLQLINASPCCEVTEAEEKGNKKEAMTSLPRKAELSILHLFLPLSGRPNVGGIQSLESSLAFPHVVPQPNNARRPYTKAWLTRPSCKPMRKAAIRAHNHIPPAV